MMKGQNNMTAPISANANVQQPVIAPDFKPSYNAVQLNLSQPTLNVPPSQPAPLPATASKQWNA